MRAHSQWVALCCSTLLVACSGGSAPDLSALDDPKSQNAFVVATAEIADFQCESRALEIGQRSADGTYKQVTRVAIGTSWAPMIGVQTSLPPGEYHIVGMTCTTKGNAMMVMPGRREASAVPFSPIYQDSIASFTLGAREVVSIGAFRFTLGDKGPFGIAHAPLPAEILAAAKQSQPLIRDRLAARAPAAVARSVDGRCVAGNARMDCAELGKARALCKTESPPGEDVAVVALRARLKAILCV